MAGKQHFVSLRLEPGSELTKRFEYLLRKTGLSTRKSLVIHLINISYDRYQWENSNQKENHQDDIK